MINENANLRAWEKSVMKRPPVHLEKAEREEVLHSIGETCRFRGWKLWAAHVRPTHVHVITEAGDEAPIAPERIMRDLKGYATRRLNAAGFLRHGWSRHGSTLYLWDRQAVHDAIVYVCEGQGPPMEIYLCPEW